MKLSARVDKIEDAFLKHLEESGAIRTDLAWLKKAFWVLCVAYVGAVVTNFVKQEPHNATYERVSRLP